jgi:small membrane protein
MAPIQFLLIALLAILLTAYLIRIRTHVFGRLIVFSLIVPGIVLVIMPEWANNLAHFFGVGRGADLIMYLGFIGTGYCLLIIYAKLRDTEARLTELARQTAIQHAHTPDEHQSSLGDSISY